MDHYADDLAAVTEHLNLTRAIHVGHSTGGGEVAHYIARHGSKRVAKAVLVSSVVPMMAKGPKNPDGVPMDVLDGIRAAVATNRTPKCAATAGDYIEVRTAALRVRRSPSEHDRLTPEHARSQRDQPDRTEG